MKGIIFKKQQHIIGQGISIFIVYLYMMHCLAWHAFFHEGFKQFGHVMHLGCKQFAHFRQRFLDFFVGTVGRDVVEGAPCGW